MRHWIQKSFRNRILASVLLITLLPLLLSNVLLLGYQIRRTDAQQQERADELLVSGSALLNGLTSRMQTLSEELTGSTIVHSVLRRGGSDSRILYQELYRQAGTLREYCRVDICLPDGSCAYSTANSAPESTQKTYWGVLRAASDAQGLVYRVGAEESETLQAAAAVRSYDGDILGYVLFTVTNASLDKLFAQALDSSEDLLLLSPQWELVYNSRPIGADAVADELRTRLLSGQSVQVDARGAYSFTFSEDSATGCVLVLRQSLIFSATVRKTFTFASAALGLTSLALCLVYALWLSRNLSAPIATLSRAMERVVQGDLSVQLRTRRVDEFGRLTDDFNRMTREYSAHLRRSVEHQRELNEARIRLMQAQLNPHFLYNTLDSMKWLGVTHGVPQIAELAANLAALLRFSISQAEFVTVEQELTLIDRYLEIQYLRYADRFSCEVDVDERYQHCRMPKMLLEPVVENAIIHGVAAQNEGYIKLTAWDENGTLVLCVQDNGCGFSPEALAEITKGTGKHLGLYNVNEILCLHYGENYGVRVENIPEGGSRVMLRLPLQRQTQEGTLC